MMTAQPLAHPLEDTALAREASTWAEQVDLMETMARKALQTSRGIRTASMWITGTQDSPVLHAHVSVATSDALPDVVDYVADDLVRILEHMQGRPFASHDLDFTIAGQPAGSRGPQQILTIT